MAAPPVSPAAAEHPVAAVSSTEVVRAPLRLPPQQALALLEQCRCRGGGGGGAAPDQVAAGSAAPAGWRTGTAPPALPQWKWCT